MISTALLAKGLRYVVGVAVVAGGTLRCIAERGSLTLAVLTGIGEGQASPIDWGWGVLESAAGLLLLLGWSALGADALLTITALVAGACVLRPDAIELSPGGFLMPEGVHALRYAVAGCGVLIFLAIGVPRRSVGALALVCVLLIGGATPLWTDGRAHAGEQGSGARCVIRWKGRDGRGNAAGAVILGPYLGLNSRQPGLLARTSQGAVDSCVRGIAVYGSDEAQLGCLEEVLAGLDGSAVVRILTIRHLEERLEWLAGVAGVEKRKYASQPSLLDGQSIVIARSWGASCNGVGGVVCVRKGALGLVLRQSGVASGLDGPGACAVVVECAVESAGQQSAGLYSVVDVGAPIGRCVWETGQDSLIEFGELPASVTVTIERSSSASPSTVRTIHCCAGPEDPLASRVVGVLVMPLKALSTDSERVRVEVAVVARSGRKLQEFDAAERDVRTELLRLLSSMVDTGDDVESIRIVIRDSG